MHFPLTSTLSPWRVCGIHIKVFIKGIQGKIIIIQSFHPLIIWDLVTIVPITPWVDSVAKFQFFYQFFRIKYYLIFMLQVIMKSRKCRWNIRHRAMRPIVAVMFYWYFIYIIINNQYKRLPDDIFCHHISYVTLIFTLFYLFTHLIDHTISHITVFFVLV